MAILLPEIEDDGLISPELRTWSEEKLRVMWTYAKIFSRSMTGKWAGLTYIDLFAGPGASRKTNTGRLVCGSPLLALSVDPQFTKHIFCEKSSIRMRNLKERVSTLYSDSDVTFVEGDCNVSIDEIVRAIPSNSPRRKHLTFCFVDPYGLRFKFSTIRSLVDKCPAIDFLILLALRMDATRNEQIYVDGKSPIVDELLDDFEWRDAWSDAKSRGTRFGTFVAHQFAHKMISIGFLKSSLSSMMEFQCSSGQFPLYHLSFFSKNDLAHKFWGECKKYVRSQQQLDLL